MSLEQHQRVWEDLGRVDPFWAVLTDPNRRHGRWNADEFFATGEADADALMAEAEKLGLPQQHGVALDFGCGVGRMARPLASRFDQYVGVDISQPMLSQAREWNRDCTRCRFVLNTTGDFRSFEGSSIDFVHTRYVLQHLPTTALIRGYISEFVRVLKPGGLLVFQLPSHIGLLHRIQPRRRLYTFLRRVGLREQLLLGPLKLTPMVMRAVSERQVVSLIASLGAHLVRIHSGSDLDHIYFVTR